MECPNCEWESVPGTKTCPVCGFDFNARPLDRTYPPRAGRKGRTSFLSRLFGSQGRRGASKRLEPKRFELSAPVQLRTVLVTCLGFIPGLGHLLLGKPRQAVFFFGIFLTLAGLSALFWYQPFSNLTALLLVFFPLFSAAYSGAIASRKQATRKDHGALVVLPLLIVIILGWWLVGENFRAVEVRSDNLAPLLMHGEEAVVRISGLPYESFDRGTIVLHRGVTRRFAANPHFRIAGRLGYYLGRIVGLPGERVVTGRRRIQIFSIKGDSILGNPVNFMVPVELHPDWQPTVELDISLNENEYFIVSGRVGWIVTRDELMGKPIGVILPPQSRRFLVD
ncbi:MAG: hypothetical protein JW941_07850 [Candidatus Coatesbacteria bacterium]|nr:hypothetical protein [Candidatus Coatesbacteria bacterium]